MAKIAEMTQLSPTMTEGTIVNWLKKEGDTVNPGEILAEVETDKAVMEMEAYDSGTILAILAGPGMKVSVGLPLLILGQPGEDVTGLVEASKAKLASAKSTAAQKPEPSPAPTQSVAVVPNPPKVTPAEPKALPTEKTRTSRTGFTGRVIASPLARATAIEKSVDLKQVVGTGPAGRILQKDVLLFLSGSGGSSSKPTSKQAPVSNQSLPVSNMRKVIADRLTSSKQNLPHFYLEVEIDAEPLTAFRERFNLGVQSLSSGDPSGKQTKISLNDLIVKATALALQHHPQVNASWMGDEILRYGRIDIGIAVSLEEGLITPVLRNANQLGLLTVSEEIRSLADRAKKRKLKPDEFTGSTFTISNLGMFGIHFFTAIINEPEAAILAVGGVVEKPVVKNGFVVAGKTLALTLSCDHRVIDGAEGAKFLQTLKKFLENPELLTL